MRLKALSAEDCEQVRLWRNEQLESLRTPFPLAKEQQNIFYETVICNRQANARFWGIWVNKKVTLPMQKPMEDIETEGKILIGMCGLENVSWENRLAEISLLFNPDYPMDKYGEESLRLLLHEGFNNMNIENIFTEVYYCNPASDFWFDIAKKYSSIVAFLPYRKYYNGKYYHSTYININKGAFVAHENLISQPA